MTAEQGSAASANPVAAPLRPTSVKAVKNGPLQVKGSFSLLDPHGEAYDLDGQRIVLLCRCGQSKNQPFCDSSHRATGFISDDAVPGTDRGESAP